MALSLQFYVQYQQQPYCLLYMNIPKNLWHKYSKQLLFNLNKLLEFVIIWLRFTWRCYCCCFLFYTQGNDDANILIILYTYVYILTWVEEARPYLLHTIRNVQNIFIISHFRSFDEFPAEAVRRDVLNNSQKFDKQIILKIFSHNRNIF